MLWVMSKCNGLLVVLRAFLFSIPKVMLTVRDVESRDRGMYKCVTKTTKGHKLAERVSLDVESRATASSHCKVIFIGVAESNWHAIQVTIIAGTLLLLLAVLIMLLFTVQRSNVEQRLFGT